VTEVKLVKDLEMIYQFAVVIFFPDKEVVLNKKTLKTTVSRFKKNLVYI